MSDKPTGFWARRGTNKRHYYLDDSTLPICGQWVPRHRRYREVVVDDDSDNCQRCQQSKRRLEAQS